jgi:hypothetical protein
VAPIYRPLLSRRFFGIERSSVSKYLILIHGPDTIRTCDLRLRRRAGRLKAGFGTQSC